MSATKQERAQEPAPHHSGNPPHQPYWQRAHRSPGFWIAVVAILAAMTIYVLTNNLSQPPGRPLQPAVPAATN